MSLIRNWIIPASCLLFGASITLPADARPPLPLLSLGLGLTYAFRRQLFGKPPTLQAVSPAPT